MRSQKDEERMREEIERRRKARGDRKRKREGKSRQQDRERISEETGYGRYGGEKTMKERNRMGW